MAHVFDEAIALRAVSDDVFRAQTHPAYNNMVGPFGGVVAGTVVHGLQQHPEAVGDPLTLTINYAAPIAEGEWELHTHLIRTNRTNQHWTFTLVQGDNVVGTGTAIFGIRRDTWGDTEAEPPAIGRPADYEPFEFPEFIAWAQNYDKRFVTGDLTGGKSDDSTSTVWLQDRPERALDYPALASMADAFFPRVFLRFGTYLPAGTISLTIYFHASPAELAAHGTSHLLGTARAVRFGHGHFDQSAALWGGDVLLATTHQLVYFKEPA